jgi:hypothetical protein
MKPIGIAAASSLVMLAAPASAQPGKAANHALKAITQDGRTVVLHTNGTWTYAAAGRSATIGSSRPPGATMLLAGRQVPYGIWIDQARWRFTDPKQNMAAELELTHVSNQAGALIVAEPRQIPPESWKQIVINNARREAPDARITREERKVVNGVPVSVLQSEGTGPMGPVVYYGYYYAGPRGAVQVVTYTFAATFEQYRADFTAFLDGFVILE